MGYCPVACPPLVSPQFQNHVNFRRLQVPCRRPSQRQAGPVGSFIQRVSVDDERAADLLDTEESPDELWKGLDVPRRKAGKKRKLLLLGLAAALEYWATSAIMWSPMLGIAAFVLFSASDKELQMQEQDLVERARKQAVLEYWRKMPVTPKEPVEWLNRLLQGLWNGYVQQFVVTNNLSLWQEKIADATPQGWDIQINDFDLGQRAPTLSDVHVLNDTKKSGQLAAMDMAVAFDSGTLSVTAEGSGPVGNFSMSVSGVKMTGNVRILPVFEHRMLLYAFKEAPHIDLKLGVTGPAIGKMTIPEFDFLKRAIRTAITDLMVEPSRGCISLDYQPVGNRAVDTVCNLEVISISDVQTAKKSSNGTSPQSMPIRIEVTNFATKLIRSTSTAILSNGQAYFGETLSLNLGDADGVVDFKVIAVQQAEKKSAPKQLGTYRVNISHLGDGSTGFWSVDRDWRPVACRWKEDDPWEVTLPVQGLPGASVKMKLSTEEWTYMQPYSPMTYRSKGDRTVVVQVIEARDLVPKDMDNKSDPYVKLNYDSRTYTTRTVFKTINPVWGEVFIFSENSSLISSKIRGEIWDKDFTSGDDREGFFFLDLDLASEGELVDRWFQLSGEESGEVRIQFTVLPGMVNSQFVTEYVKNLRNSPLTASVPTVAVSVWGGKNLMPVNPSGKSNPYCVLRYGDVEQNTPAIKNTQNPSWNFTALFPYNACVSEVRIECFDKERIQLLQRSQGSTSLLVDKLVPSEGDKWEDWISLTGGGQGMINVGLVKCPEDTQYGTSSYSKTDEGSDEKKVVEATSKVERNEFGQGDANMSPSSSLPIEDFSRDAKKQVDNIMKNIQKFFSE